jgi:hypothetical protein
MTEPICCSNQKLKSEVRRVFPKLSFASIIKAGFGGQPAVPARDILWTIIKQHPTMFGGSLVHDTAPEWGLVVLASRTLPL